MKLEKDQKYFSNAKCVIERVGALHSIVLASCCLMANPKACPDNPKHITKYFF
jgi:hypothetical protein